MRRVRLRVLLAVAGLTGCAGASVSPAPTVVAQTPPIEAVEGGAGAHAAPLPADSGVDAQEAPRQGDVADTDVAPAVTEACVNECRAAGSELLQGVDDRLAELERDCRAGASATRQKCLAAAHDEYVEARQAAEGNEHACRTNCPGYLNQYR